MNKDTSVKLRISGAIIAVVGILAVVASIGSATWWRASDLLRATTPAASGAQYVVTEPGVLQLSGAVTATATSAAGTTVEIAVGHAVDVAGWVEGTSVSAVSGLATRTSLRASVQEGLATGGGASTASPSADAGAGEDSPTAAATGVALSASDMWLDHASGTGSATLRWSGTDTRVLLVATAVSSDGTTVSAPSLTLRWTQEVATPWLWPGAVVGALLLVLGALLLLRGVSARRAAGEPSDDAAEDLSEAPEQDVAAPSEPAAVPSPAIASAPAAVEQAPLGDLGAFSRRDVTVTSAPGTSSGTVVPGKETSTVAEPVRSAFAPAAPVTEPAREAVPETGAVTEPAVSRPTEVPDTPRPALAAPAVVVGRHTASIPRVQERRADAPVSTAVPVTPPAPATGSQPAVTGTVPAVVPGADGEPMTRRRLRELRAQGLVPPVGTVSSGTPVASGATRPVGGDATGGSGATRPGATAGSPVSAFVPRGTAPGASAPGTSTPGAVTTSGTGAQQDGRLPGASLAPSGSSVPAPSAPESPATGSTPALPDGSAASAAGWRQAWGVSSTRAATPTTSEGAPDGPAAPTGGTPAGSDPDQVVPPRTTDDHEGDQS